MSQIQFDAVTNSSIIGNTSLTYLHTASGIERIVFVSVITTGISGRDSITGVTYDGQAMTLVDKQANSQPSNYEYLYYLINPPTGSKNVIVSCSESANIGSGAVSYTGALQSGVPDAKNKGTATGTSIVTSVTAVSDNCWMVSVCSIVNVGVPQAGTNVTKRADTGGNGSIGDTNGVVHPAGAFSMRWTQTGTEVFAVLQASFAPSPVSPSASLSASISPSSSSSASLSPSSSSSPSISPSSSRSPSSSNSPSASVSPSPSQGFADYTRQASITLPTNDNDLSIAYTQQEILKTQTESNGIPDIENDIGQEGSLEYMIHQFKNFVGNATECTIILSGESTLAPKLSPIYLQVFNHLTGNWDTLATNTTADADITIALQSERIDLNKYKQSQVITTRMWQLAI